MAERTTAAKRIKLANIAEREVMRYADDHALWHKHVHQVDLDAMQVLKCIEMDMHKNTMDFSCRRTGKTAIKEMFLLKECSTKPDQELGIVAPREAQSLVNLGYHLDAIRRSPILSAYLAHKSGRTQLADTYYQFANRSGAQAYGIMAQVDGGDLTMASLEEVDDMPKDRLFNRFLLMMGSTRRLGANKNSKNDPQIRVTGVFKGADTLTDLIDSGKYRVLPPIDAYLGMEMGILNRKFIMDMRDQLAPDEYIRQLLCRNVSARNLVWEKHVRRAMQVGLEAGLQIESPLPGARYKAHGLITLGYDCGGHGEDANASRHAVVICEQRGSFVSIPYCRTWPAGADDRVVERDLVGLWDYFRPQTGFGDAYGIGIITHVNDELYAQGLIDTDRRTIGDGESTASTWSDWAFSPIRFEGMTKHSMATAVRSIFHNGHAVMPYIDDLDMQDPELADMRTLMRQLPNIKPVTTKSSYASYKMANPKLGDDLFDATMAAVWALVTRGGIQMPTSISTRTQSRDRLLGHGVTAANAYLVMAYMQRLTHHGIRR